MRVDIQTSKQNGSDMILIKEGYNMTTYIYRFENGAVLVTLKKLTAKELNYETRKNGRLVSCKTARA